MCTWTEWLLVFLLFEQKIPTSTLYYPATSLRQLVQEKHTPPVCVCKHTPPSPNQPQRKMWPCSWLGWLPVE